MMKDPVPETVDQYLSFFPAATRALLEQLRMTIRQAAPLAEEVISYQMPAYKFHGALVYFGGYKKHIGFYPTSSIIPLFGDRLRDYSCSKGTIQFPLDQPMPLELITDIVQTRVAQNLEKEALRRARKKK